MNRIACLVKKLFKDLDRLNLALENIGKQMTKLEEETDFWLRYISDWGNL